MRFIALSALFLLVGCGASNDSDNAGGGGGISSGFRPVSYTNTDGSGGTYAYNAKGQLIQENKVDSEGRTQSIAYIYNTDGTRMRAEYSDGDTLTHKYANGQRISSRFTWADGLGFTMAYAHNGAGQWQEATTDAEIKVAYTYNDSGDIIGSETSDPYGGTYTTEYIYNSNGQRIKTKRSTGEEITYTYSDNGQLASEQTSDGETTVYTYDSDARRMYAVTTDVSGHSYKNTYIYNDDGKLIRVEEADGDVTIYTRQGADDPTQVKSQNAEGQVMMVGDYVYEESYCISEIPIDNDLDGIAEDYDCFEYEYILVGIDMSISIKQAYTYDEQGHITNMTMTDTDGNEHTSTYTYDNAGQLIRTEASTGDMTTYTYNSLGQLAAIQTTEADGSVNTVNVVYESAACTHFYDHAEPLTAVLDVATCQN